jgi:hypothetical protein
MLGTFNVVGNTLRFTFDGVDDNANRVLNGDFELWDSPPTVPVSWLISAPQNGNPGTQVVGLDGTGYAVELVTQGGLPGGLYQTVPTQLTVTGPFTAAMDFAFGTGTSERTFNPSIREGTGTIRINIRTAVDPANPTGPQDLEFHDGAAWHTVAADLVPSNFAGGVVHAYRLEISGDTMANSMFVTVTDLTTGTPVVADLDASAWWSTEPGATGGLNHFRFDTQRITGPCRIDNVTLTAHAQVSGRFDFDGNGAVNLDDLSRFAQCTTGAAVSGPPAGCASGDYLRADDDDDQDVDMDDFAALQRCISTGGSADPDCL